jgi:hypothetical protein
MKKKSKQKQMRTMSIKNKNKNVINIQIHTSKKSKNNKEGNSAETRRFPGRTEIVHHFSSPQLINYQPYNAPSINPQSGLVANKDVTLLNTPVTNHPPDLVKNKDVTPLNHTPLKPKQLGLTTNPPPDLFKNKGVNPFNAPNLVNNTSNALSSSSKDALFSNYSPLNPPLSLVANGGVTPLDYMSDDATEYEKPLTRTTERKKNKPRKKLQDFIIEEDEGYVDDSNAMNVEALSYDKQIENDYNTIKLIYQKYDPKQLKHLQPLEHYINGNGRQRNSLNKKLEKAKLLTQETQETKATKRIKKKA